jgi:hypothetical protein
MQMLTKQDFAAAKARHAKKAAEEKAAKTTQAPQAIAKGMATAATADDIRAALRAMAAERYKPKVAKPKGKPKE